MLFKAVILEWAKFLEKINKNLPKLISKIESEAVSRGNLKKFEKTLWPFFKHCYYCKTSLKGKKIHVDHFIPFVYIGEDEIWNLTLSCKKCNCKKLGSLAPKYFLKKIISRNQDYRNKIEGLDRSLQMLDLGYGFEKIIEDHFINASRQGYKILQEDDFLHN